jgi:hypothetical protein
MTTKGKFLYKAVFSLSILNRCSHFVRQCLKNSLEEMSRIYKLLNFQFTVVIKFTACFNMQNLCILPTQCPSKLNMIQRKNTNYFSIRCLPSGLSMCSLWGTNCLSKYSWVQVPRPVREWNIVMCPLELGTKNHFAGEGQQQLLRLKGLIQTAY